MGKSTRQLVYGSIIATCSCFLCLLFHQEILEREWKKFDRPLISIGSWSDNQRDHSIQPGSLSHERIRAYRKVLSAIVNLNTEVIQMEPVHLREEADILVHGGDSELDDAYDQVNRKYQSSFHVIAPDVKTSVGEYIDYLATYHDEGIEKGEVLKRSRRVVETIRNDLGVNPLTEETDTASDHFRGQVNNSPKVKDYPPNEELGNIKTDDQI